MHQERFRNKTVKANSQQQKYQPMQLLNADQSPVWLFAAVDSPIQNIVSPSNWVENSPSDLLLSQQKHPPQVHQLHAVPWQQTAMAMLIRAKPKNSMEFDSDSVSRTATKFTTAPTNQQDSTALKFCAVPSSVQNFLHSNFDKANQAIFTYEPTGPTENNFNTDRTLGATLRAEHYAAFRRPPPTYDKTLCCLSPTDKFKTDRTLGATLRADHYQGVPELVLQKVTGTVSCWEVGLGSEDGSRSVESPTIPARDKNNWQASPPTSHFNTGSKFFTSSEYRSKNFTSSEYRSKIFTSSEYRSILFTSSQYRRIFHVHSKPDARKLNQINQANWQIRMPPPPETRE